MEDVNGGSTITKAAWIADKEECFAPLRCHFVDCGAASTGLRLFRSALRKLGMKFIIAVRKSYIIIFRRIAETPTP